MFAVNAQAKGIICIMFNGENFTCMFTASIAPMLKMTSDEYFNYMRTNFNCYFNGYEPLFFSEKEAQRAVDSLNVLYKLLNAK